MTTASPGVRKAHKIWVGKEALADWKAKLTEGDELAFTCGYALRPKGIEAGLAHEHDHDLVAVLEGVLALQDADEAKAILKRRIEALRLANMAEELAA